LKDLREGLKVQGRVIHADILRETRTRYGRYQLGYIWAFIEPLFWVLTFYGMFHFMGRAVPAGMDVFAFLVTGIVPYLMFKSILNRCLPAIIGNKPLLFYPQVRPLDIAIGRAALEAFTLTFVFVVLLGASALYRGELRIDSVVGVLGGLTLAWLLGFSVGTSLMGLSVFFPAVERVTPIVLRPLFWISGLFFTANELPPQVGDVLLYNPVLHVVELTRQGWFIEYQAHRLDVVYVIQWILVFGYLGLLLERLARRRMDLT
jgi:capsular polysaccharide transport system permease protein